MRRRVELIGVPSSAGAYAPGQEKAPEVLRSLGIVDTLRSANAHVIDRGDVEGFVWRPDARRPHAMNASAAARIAAAVASEVSDALDRSDEVFVLGGDCTVGIGTVAGALQVAPSLGLIYFDLDTDLNTPNSTNDGALDWMGVAHLLDIPGTISDFHDRCGLERFLRPDQLAFFGHDNVTPFERNVIDSLAVQEFPLHEVIHGPEETAARAVDWGRNFDRILVHLDADVLDFADLPIAENNRRNRGINFDQLIAALCPLVRADNFAGITVTEINPDHSGPERIPLRRFLDGLVSVFRR